jgi:uncharacterized protein YceK
MKKFILTLMLCCVFATTSGCTTVKKIIDSPYSISMHHHRMGDKWEVGIHLRIKF